MSDICPAVEVKKAPSSDRAIHIWANRGSNFVSNRFAQNLEFQQFKEENPTWTGVRKILMLDREDTDVYLFKALSLLTSYSGLTNQVKDNQFTQSASNLPVAEDPTIQDGSIVNHGNRYSKFLRYDKAFPIPKTYTIEYSTESSIRVITDTGLISDVAVKINQSYGDPPKPLGYTNLIATWGDALPFKGTLRYPGLWNLGSKMIINYVPQSIDYKIWVSSIDEQLHITPLLERVNQHEAYNLAKDPTEKLAVLYLSLILYYDLEVDNG